MPGCFISKARRDMIRFTEAVFPVPGFPAMYNARLFDLVGLLLLLFFEDEDEADGVSVVDKQALKKVLMARPSVSRQGNQYSSCSGGGEEAERRPTRRCTNVLFIIILNFKQ